MSKRRLQVVLGDDELRAYEDCAATLGMTVSAWVRQALRREQQEVARGDVDAKLAAVRRAVSCSFPTSDIDQMLAEIERGYVAPDTA